MEYTANRVRCDWPTTDPLYLAYHDEEWGVPLYDSQKLFELLILEGMQAGLSWITVLKKREALRQAFLNFQPEKLVQLDALAIQHLLENKAIIRNKLKIHAVIQNAEAYLALETSGGFADFLWGFVDGAPIQNHWKRLSNIPAHTEISEQMAKALKQKQFKFVGSTICYAFMQAAGMVNDHLVHCYRHEMVQKTKG